MRTNLAEVRSNGVHCYTEYRCRPLFKRLIADGKPVTLNELQVNRRAYALYRRLGFSEANRIVDGPAVTIRMVARS